MLCLIHLHFSPKASFYDTSDMICKDVKLMVNERGGETNKTPPSLTHPIDIIVIVLNGIVAGMQRL